MPDELLTPAAMGFAEFTAQLISEVFEAMIAAQAEQEERRAAFLETAALTPAEYASRFIKEADVDAELAALFPSADGKTPHAIFTGALYQEASEKTPETPPVAALLGVLLASDDARAGQNRQVALTDKGVQKIREAARLSAAARRLAPLRTMAEQGIPRLVVDAGRLTAKLTFQVAQTVSSTTPSTPPVTGTTPTPPTIPTTPPTRPPLQPTLPTVPLRPLTALTPALSSIRRPIAELANVRLVVRQASDQTPQANTTGTLTGEVEISFRTVI